MPRPPPGPSRGTPGGADKTGSSQKGNWLRASLVCAPAAGIESGDRGVIPSYLGLLYAAT